MTKKPEYPEHEKQRKVLVESNAIGEFIDTGGYHLSKPHVHVEDCGHIQRDGYGQGCERFKGSLEPVHATIEKILADYFGIDLKRINAEKEQMLEAIRAR